jgi:threonyl-tRNA synthetase
MSHIQLKLPDGSMRDVAMDSSIAQFAHQISPSLAKSAIAAILDGQAVDLSTPLIAEHHEKTIEILTEKNTEHPIVLEIIRHSTAHLLAHAVKELFPDAQVTIGPVVDNGFYYDFSYKRPFTPEDLTSIEQKMVEIQKRSLPVKRLTMSRTEAIDFFKNLGEYYKAELIESIPQGEILSLYQQDNFTDLCRGPHVPNTNKLKVFKLMKLAGAYWRGNHENEMLQRVYGTAWVKEEDQKQYLHQL